MTLFSIFFNLAYAEEPQWITNIPIDPTGVIRYGTGMQKITTSKSTARDLAINNAKQMLIANVSQSIQCKSVENSTTQQQGNSAKNYSTTKQQCNFETTLSNIPNLIVLEARPSPDGKQYYALVQLDLQELADSITSDINQQLQPHHNQTSLPHLKAIKAIISSKDFINNIQLLNNIPIKSTEPLANYPSLIEINQAIFQAQKKITFFINKAEGFYNREHIKKTINEIGFAVTSQKENDLISLVPINSTTSLTCNVTQYDNDTLHGCIASYSLEIGSNNNIRSFANTLTLAPSYNLSKITQSAIQQLNQHYQQALGEYYE
ncbi:MAG: hypothetical protein QM538_05715 [Methylacidiphilales bacterium]|nr:hypothetical protein [Candidatus Methylacidiphilales bacterium]